MKIPKITFKTRYGIKVYTDPNGSGKPILTGLKGKTAMDAGAFYAPYVPLQMTSVGRSMVRGHIWGWTTFILTGYDRAEIESWCESNLGRRHRGVYLAGLGIWLGNRGRWRMDGLGDALTDIDHGYIRVWLHRPEDITLFQMVWSA